MHAIVSLSFRQLVLNKYPALLDNAPFLRFFYYLCFSDFFDEETSQLVIPTKTISEEFYQVLYVPRFNGKAKLEEFRDAVLPDLAWTEYDPFSPNSWKGQARQLSCLGFDDEMQEAIRKECLTQEKDQVEFVSGKPYRREHRYEDSAKATAQYRKELQALTLNATQQKIVDYMNTLNAGHLFLRHIHKNITPIAAAIDALKPELRPIQERILKAIQLNPHLYYLPSVKNHTCRLSPRGDTVLGLKSEVRKAATKGWVECDLRSSQFAILAETLKAPLSRSLIASGVSLWRSCYQHTHGIDDEPPPGLKKVFKEVIYSICYGKGKRNLGKVLKKHEISTLLQHTVIQEVLSLREKWFQEIRNAGGAHDVWGQWHAIDDTIDPRTKRSMRWEGAVAATVIQSIEMEIVAPIFDVALAHGKNDQFRICLFQHDGATISFGSRQKEGRAKAKLKEAVECRARALGVNTVLEFTQL